METLHVEESLIHVKVMVGITSLPSLFRSYWTNSRYCGLTPCTCQLCTLTPNGKLVELAICFSTRSSMTNYSKVPRLYITTDNILIQCAHHPHPVHLHKVQSHTRIQRSEKVDKLAKVRPGKYTHQCRPH